MSRGGGSGGRWRRRQEKDPFVQRARREGWRSRAVFKLEQILERDMLVKPGMVCVDLGAAPGGWSQFLAARLKGRGRVIALDVLPMDGLADVEFLQGDFTDDAVLESLLELLGDGGADLVTSDMAPNMSGNKVIDQPRSMLLAELALDFAGRVLTRGGSFICKYFQGAGAEEFIAAARHAFGSVRTVKPKASRAGSSEMYLVARNYQL